MRGSLKITSSILLISSFIVNQAQAVCRAAAFAGGGSRGAYEAGVVYGFNHAKNPADFSWDVVTGVSAGALNSAGIALWAPNQGKEMSEWLEQVWLNLTSSQIYVDWPLGWLDGITKESGIFDNTPLLNLVTKLYTSFGSVKRKTVVSSVDVNTGQYVIFDDSMPFSDLPLLTVASASIPFIFPHRHYGDHILMDGGTVWNTNLISAVDKCKAMGHADSDIILDIILCDQKGISEIGDTGNALNNFLRYYTIQSYYSGMNDILEFKKTRPNVQYRYLTLPTGPVANGLNMINFNPSNTVPMIELGKKDAANAIKLGEGKGFELFEQYMKLSPQEQDQLSINEYFAMHYEKA
ncbi:patatin-like phospholipase family protein [Stylonychia lemnae]|uniref:Patatin-like phospholipase family protein n=1 Tax=Stylonychia lemnae TaxID=5949 RepID=A0A077ZPS6_STYLE|nr:patatin-like phospholipase family protein [Stylonychia lemnae]|eukprot:CDW71375.1 patatin-like phospholipase family protein [Stylonychia lemnae]